MTFCVKDEASFRADVKFVENELKTATGIRQTITDGVARFELQTESYNVTQWIHQNPKYSAWLAIAKDGSHTVTWYEHSGQISRW